MIPNLITALSGPLGEIEQRLLRAGTVIERWFRLEWLKHTPPFYSSVDIRNAGFKVAPVDTNLFPGGWNNLPPGMLPAAARAAAATIRQTRPQARELLLLPENHTRNPFYLRNILALQQILSQAGMAVRLGSLNPDITAPARVDLPDGQQLLLEPLVRRDGRLGLEDFDPDIILLNNDLSAGVPDLLQGLAGQTLLPSLHAGWHVRRKSRHFEAYDKVAERFASVLGIDPWLIGTLCSHCAGVDFGNGQGIERLQSKVDALLARIRHKYQEYGIADQPFVVIKADNGTYGMGIMTVRDASELASLNRRTRNKMATIKDGQRVSDVIIQEGVLTQDRLQEAVAEPVVYMMGRHVAGAFYRANASRRVDENLNAPGAVFVPMTPQCGSGEPSRFHLYGVIGLLAALAASCELEPANCDAAQTLALA
ncbi:glutamate--cysteine ligase [Cupriavidus pinatubonensis]|uniref:Glutamate--cysteine ligase n=1 Tax=Cupriavidus pinatubonensis TaxID=248026 RepID=A0ABN7Z782_9BURK|nr:glutamate--cysteine ligase [Cupriavidus pinatubonensis]CAG9181083.1 hypothetical protein LMG23994_04574 [Cupriavidus pinatubonensis]